MSKLFGLNICYKRIEVPEYDCDICENTRKIKGMQCLYCKDKSSNMQITDVSISILKIRTHEFKAIVDGKTTFHLEIFHWPKKQYNEYDIYHITHNHLHSNYFKLLLDRHVFFEDIDSCTSYIKSIDTTKLFRNNYFLNYEYIFLLENNHMSHTVNLKEYTEGMRELFKEGCSRFYGEDLKVYKTINIDIKNNSDTISIR